MMQPTKKKIRSRHKVNIKKQRLKQKKIADKKQKEIQKEQDIKPDKLKQKTARDTALDIRISRETRIYWLRGATGALSAFILRLIGFVGWTLFLWMIGFMLIFPFVLNYTLGYEYDKEEWTWKNVLKPGLGLFFFLFMFVGVILHTSFDIMGIGIKITFQGIIFP